MFCEPRAAVVLVRDALRVRGDAGAAGAARDGRDGASDPAEGGRASYRARARAPAAAALVLSGPPRLARADARDDPPRPARPPARPRRPPRRARRTSRSRAASTRRCTASGCGRCASTPASRPPRRPTSATAPSSRPARPASRSPSTCRPRSATTPTTRSREGEVGKVGVTICSIDDVRRLFDGIPLDSVTTCMTINATAPILLALYVAVAKEQGADLTRLGGHDPERHPQGVRRARHVHLPAAPVDAAHHGHLRVVRGRAAALEHDLDLGLPHPRGRLDGGRGARLHARRRHRLRPGGRSTPGSTSTSSAGGCRSSSTPTTTSSRRSPSSAPRGACGPASCATASARPTRGR